MFRVILDPDFFGENVIRNNSWGTVVVQLYATFRKKLRGILNDKKKSTRVVQFYAIPTWSVGLYYFSKYKIFKLHIIL